MQSTKNFTIGRFGARAVLALLLATGASAVLAQGTITSNGTNFVRTASAFDVSPEANFTAAGPPGDQVFEFGWAYRADADTRERFMPAPTTQNYTADTSTITWTNLPNAGLNAQEVTQVVGFDGPDTAHVISTMTFTNPTAAAITVDVFVAIDIDQNGSAGTDVVTLNAGNNAMVITDSSFGNFVGVGAQNRMVRPFAAATDVFGLLGDALVTNLDNSGIPSAAIDMTGAYQWTTLSIPAGGSQAYVAQFSANRNVPFTGSTADVSLALADSPDPANEGGALAYTATATNNGPDPANDIAITMAVPANLTFVNATGGTCVGAGPITCTTAGATASGASAVSTFNFTVNVGASAASPIAASASVASTGATDPNAGNNTANASTVINPPASADVALTLADTPDPANEGGALAYTATATNNGPNATNDIAITMAVPANTTFVNATGGTCVGAGPVTCTTAGATASGASVVSTFNFTVNAGASAASPIAASASVASTGATDPNLGNNTANASTVINPPTADLSMLLTATPNPVAAGGQVTFVATLTNLGPGPADNLAINMTLPAGLTFVSATPSGMGLCNAASPVSCTFAGTFASGSSVTATIVAQVPINFSGGLVTNVSATGTTTSNDTIPANNTGTISLTVLGGTVSNIPTLGWLGMLMMALTLGGLGMMLVRRQA